MEVSKKTISSKEWLKLRKVIDKEDYFGKKDVALLEEAFGGSLYWPTGYGEGAGEFHFCGVHYLVEKLRFGQYWVSTIKKNCPTRGGIRNYWIDELWTFR